MVGHRTVTIGDEGAHRIEVRGERQSEHRSKVLQAHGQLTVLPKRSHHYHCRIRSRGAEVRIYRLLQCDTWAFVPALKQGAEINIAGVC